MKAQLAKLRDVIEQTAMRPAPAEQERTSLRVQVRQETYAWLCSIAGEHGIGGALDLMAEIHGLIEKAGDPAAKIAY